MITIITSVRDTESFNCLKRNLINFEPDWKIGLDLICVVKDEKLFLESRDFLLENVNRGECRIVLGDSLQSANQYLTDKNPYVFVLAENILIPPGGITKLYENFIQKPRAGFISGVFKEYPTVYWVRDIYGTPQYIYSNEKEDYDLLMDVDVSMPYGLLTSTQNYKEFFGMSNLEGYGSYSYGIRLRRQGYKNYVNTGVEYKHGGKK